jgi:acyl carrier protein
MMKPVHEVEIEEMRRLVADVLEIEPHELTDTGDFVEDYNADSLRAVEILAQIEKKYKVYIPQSELPNMQNLTAVYRVLGSYAGWES